MTNDIKNGGPAFPTNTLHVPFEQSDLSQYQGMSLRDWFAGMALQGILYMVSHGKHDTIPHGPQGVAEEAYRIASAMLKARES